MGNTIVVKNIEELNAAIKKVQPGDIVILQNGEWKDATIKLLCSGTKEKPILFKAQTAGKVIITGHSQLRLGGDYIVVDGLYFINGYAGEDPVINFRVDNKHLANSCRVTNTSINDFNNPKRMDENYWVAFYGKNNRLDHCSFRDKKNLGVLLAVILDDERSRENYHAIDHNYFGRRPPLGSNGGEIIRVGVSQHCEFNSNTQITDNFFEYCDGETEIVSIKSCSNVVRGNLFKESQGGVVLRHGNYNTVENNIFFGNDKEGTGGVRVINRGQWVVNNLFYKCRGIDFRSPLSVMNGVPNSAPNRYVQVTDAVIANNSFYNCAAISLCEGSDTERSLPPDHVLFVNNIFYNTTDREIYHSYDNIGGISFAGNKVSAVVPQSLVAGFTRTSISFQKQGLVSIPKVNGSVTMLNDSLKNVSPSRLQRELSAMPGFSGADLVKQIQSNAFSDCGAVWFKDHQSYTVKKIQVVNCATAADIYTQLEKGPSSIILHLTASEYDFDKPLVINGDIRFTSPGKLIKINCIASTRSLFEIRGKGSLSLHNLQIDGNGIKAAHFISSSDDGGVEHYTLSIEKCRISGLSETNGCRDILYTYKSSYADSILVKNSEFTQCSTNGFTMNAENDNKGLYSAEKIVISNNLFELNNGMLLDIYRGGNDESTMGPSLIFIHNHIRIENPGKQPWIQLTGVQKSSITKNNFINKDPAQILIVYKDLVRAHHSLSDNKMPGKTETNSFVVSRDNTEK